MRNVVPCALFLFALCLGGCRDSWHDEACRLAPPPPVCTCDAPTRDAAARDGAEPESAPSPAHSDGGFPVLTAWHGFSRLAFEPLRTWARRAPAAQQDTARRGSRARKSAPAKALPADGCVDINHGTVQELMMLPGVGQGRAEAIVAARAKRPFRRRSDITRVRGIGKKTYRRMESAICPI